MILECCEREDRRDKFASGDNPPRVNGIDFVEVDYDARSLQVTFFANPGELGANHFEIHDVRRGYVLKLGDVSTKHHVLTLKFAGAGETDSPQEGRTYRLVLKDLDPGNQAGRFDPRFSDVEFTFNERVGSEVDFLHRTPPAASQLPPPKINYLAKDYASFRQLILDRWAQTMPSWRETHAADLGMTLVELLAFTADRLSYHQDAVATESYLGTARRRISVRRHARLVDYRLHEGCNARAFVHLKVAEDTGFEPQDVFFTTGFPRRFQLPEGVLSSGDVPEEAFSYVTIFEPVVEPAADWRVTADDFKDFQADVSPARDKADLVKDSRLVASVFGIFTTLRESRDAKKKAAMELNAILNETDLSDALKPPRDVAPSRKCEKPSGLPDELWRLTLPQRNRAILDLLFGESLSKARLLPRIELYTAHNEISFYTWDEHACWIPKGATSATLADCLAAKTPGCAKDAAADKQTECRRNLGALSRGDYLLFEEVKGAITGQESDAQPSRRHVVRLTKVTRAFDPQYGVNEPPSGAADTRKPIVHIEWNIRDALPFPLCVSSKSQPPYCSRIPDVSIARGNIVLVDHGLTKEIQPIGRATSQTLQTTCGTKWLPPAIEEVRDRFRPRLPEENLTYAQPLTPLLPATAVTRQSPSLAVPAIELLGLEGAGGNESVSITPELLRSENPSAFIQTWRSLPAYERYVLEDLLDPDEGRQLSEIIHWDRGDLAKADLLERVRRLMIRLHESMMWSPRSDLLGSGREDRHFVVENEDDRQAWVRFGDDEHGLAPTPGTEFYAQVRVGNGAPGNVAAGAIERIVFRRNLRDSITPRNPLPAEGGVDPEPIEQAKLLAPHAYRKNQPRAILADDYRTLVAASFAAEVQSARAVISAAGTHYHVDVAIDPLASVPDAEDLRQRVERYLETVRRIGHQVAVHLGVRVPIDLRMTVTAAAGHPHQNVRLGLMQRLSNEILPDGSLGFFHPDRLTFGQSIHSNQIVQEALKVPGVTDARVTFLGRIGGTPAAAGGADSNSWPEFLLTMGDLEIAQLDNAGSRDSGRFCLTLEGGR